MKPEKAKDNGHVLENSDLLDSLPGNFADSFNIFPEFPSDPGAAGQDWGWNTNLGDQEALDIAHGLDFELNQYENTIVRWAQRTVGKKRRAGTQSAEKTQVITQEDFEDGPQRDAFLLIFGHAEMLFDSNDLEKIKLGIEFFFCNSEEKVSFEDAALCIDPNIRVDVIRLRFMFEFWVRDWHMIMPQEAVVLPNRIELSAAQYGKFIGCDLAREAWFEPGIELEKLIDAVLHRNQDIDRDEVMVSLKNLLAHHVISEGIVEGVSRFYTTGKNPILKLEEMLASRSKVTTSLDRIQWTRQF